MKIPKGKRTRRKAAKRPKIIRIFQGCMVWIEKICHEGHWSASLGNPRDAEQWSRVTDFSIHTIYPW